MIKRNRTGKLLGLAIAVTAIFGWQQSSVHASTILQFSQNDPGSPNFIGTNNNDGTTSLSSTSNNEVFGRYLGANGYVSFDGYLNVTAQSTNAATMNGSSVMQNFTGSFSITANSNGTGTNYLSGNFVDQFTASGSSGTLSASAPPQSNVTFTSDVIPAMQYNFQRALSFSLSDFTPEAYISNGSLGSFTSNATGTFSGMVPEPMTWVLVASGLPFMILARRKKA